MKLALTHSQKIRRTALMINMIAAATMLMACGGEDKKGPTQVAAKVNKEEISVHQLNFVLQRTPGLKQDQAAAASKRILESLIDQELAVQQAAEQKLDRDPNVVMAIEAAKREILARAYADKVASAAKKPTDETISEYYNAHPGLFSQRRIYSLQEFNVEANSTQLEELTTKLKSVQNSEQAAAALRASGAKFASRVVTQAPENLPMAFVDKLSKMSEGQFTITPTKDGFGMVFVNAAKSAPVQTDKAKPAIENFLVNESKRKLVTQNIKSLRAEAKIQYMGQFASAATEAAAASDAPAAPPEPASSGLDADALQKGISGLK